MNDNIIKFKTAFMPASYSAKAFKANTVYGQFGASGTCCGHIDFTGPFAGTWALSLDEAQEIITMLLNAKQDILHNCR